MQEFMNFFMHLDCEFLQLIIYLKLQVVIFNNEEVTSKPKPKSYYYKNQKLTLNTLNPKH